MFAGLGILVTELGVAVDRVLERYISGSSSGSFFLPRVLFLPPAAGVASWRVSFARLFLATPFAWSATRRRQKERERKRERGAREKKKQKKQEVEGTEKSREIRLDGWKNRETRKRAARASREEDKMSRAMVLHGRGYVISAGRLHDRMLRLRLRVASFRGRTPCLEFATGVSCALRAI